MKKIDLGSNLYFLSGGCSKQNIAGLLAIGAGVVLAAATGPVGALAMPTLISTAVGAYACVIKNSIWLIKI